MIMAAVALLSLPLYNYTFDMMGKVRQHLLRRATQGYVGITAIEPRHRHAPDDADYVLLRA